MGNYLSYTKGEKRRSMSLGSNGSGNAHFQLFAIGYAASKNPDAKRARRSTGVYPNAQNQNPGKDIPYIPQTAEDVRKIIALDGNDCFWASFSIKTAGSGFFLRPPKCELYKGVLIPLILNSTGESVVIPGGETCKLVANAWESALPYLQESCAIQRLTEMAEIAREAADCYADLVMS